MHALAPCVGVKKPAGHAAHTDADAAEGSELAVFLGHGVGALEPAKQKCPAGHAVLEHAAAPALDE